MSGRHFRSPPDTKQCQKCAQPHDCKGRKLALCKSCFVESFREFNLVLNPNKCSLCPDVPKYRLPTVNLCLRCVTKYLNEGEITTFWKVKYKIEESDHDGYCSGGECEYKSFSRVETVEKKGFEQPKIGEVIMEEAGGGSYFCGLSEQASKAGLKEHQRRKTLKKIL